MIDTFLYVCQYLQSRITLTWEPLSLWCDLCISALIIHSINIDCASRYSARCLVWVVSWGSLRNARNNPAFSWLGFWTDWEIRQKRGQVEKQKVFANWSVDSSAEGGWSLKNRLHISHGQECGWTCSPQLSSIHERLSPGDFFCLSWRRVRKGGWRETRCMMLTWFFSCGRKRPGVGTPSRGRRWLSKRKSASSFKVILPLLTTVLLRIFLGSLVSSIDFFSWKTLKGGREYIN